MRYERTHLTLTKTDSNKYPNLQKNYLYSYKINGKEWPDKEERILGDVAKHLLDNPDRLIIFRNKIPEKALGMALDTLVKAHNFSLKLAGKKKISKEGISGMTLEALIRGHNHKVQFGTGIRYFGMRKAKNFLKEMGKK